jgi:hypothetical protein
MFAYRTYRNVKPKKNGYILCITPLEDRQVSDEMYSCFEEVGHDVSQKVESEIRESAGSDIEAG